MSQTSHASDTIVLDQPWQITIFQFLTIKSALKIEVKTGLKRSNRGPSTLSLAKRMGFEGRTKQEVLNNMETFWEEWKKIHEVKPGDDV